MPDSSQEQPESSLLNSCRRWNYVITWIAQLTLDQNLINLGINQ